MAYDRLMVSCSQCGGDFGLQDFKMPSPPSSHRLGDPGYRDSIRIAVSRMELDITLLEAEIDHVQTIQSELQRRYDLLGSSLQTHRNLLPAVRKLPQEILSHIFALYASDLTRIDLKTDAFLSESSHISQELSRYHEISRLIQIVQAPGQVCQLWRDVAFSTPALWSAIIVDLQAGANVSRVMMNWLERCGGHPLSIILRYGWGGYRVPSGDIVGKLLQSVIDSSSRWMHAAIGNLSIYTSVGLLTSLPRLESLALGSGESLPSNTAAPLLKSLCLTLDNLSVNLSHSLIPWTRLTELDITLKGRVPSTTILLLCPNLIKLVARNFTITTHSLSTPIVDHANLRTLDIQFFTTNGSQSLQFLRLPALLDVSVSYASDPHLIVQLLSLIQRSTCDLRNLSLLHHMTSDFDREAFTQLLESTPSLEKLEMEGSCCKSLVLSRFISRSRIPKLKSLSLSGPPFAHDYESLARMVQARWWTDASQGADSRLELARIQSVHVPLLRGFRFDEATSELLHMLQDEGLDLKLPEYEYYTKEAYEYYSDEANQESWLFNKQC